MIPDSTAGAIRLQKAIATSGLMSRRAAEELIGAGRVTVDGKVARLGDKVDPTSQRVEIGGIPIPLAPALVTYLLYKPVGVVTTTDDPEGRPTVSEFIPDQPRVVPVGRLDFDSEGLLLMSNDGELILRVTHPRYGITKTYVATVGGHPGQQALGRLIRGIELDDGSARALKARLLGRSGDGAMIELEIGEGRNREVRRMMDAIGHPVRRLVRTAIGPLTDRSLRPGQWRTLSTAEVAELYRAAGRGQPPS
jgi:23S rRNA pseudouridine2605 synthase